MSDTNNNLQVNNNTDPISEGNQYSPKRVPKNSKTNIYQASLSRIESRKKEWIKLNVVIKGWCSMAHPPMTWDDINHGEINIFCHRSDTIEDICHRIESEWCLNHGMLFKSFLAPNISGLAANASLEALELSPANPASNVLPPQLLPQEEDSTRIKESSPEPEHHPIQLNLPRISVSISNPPTSNSDSESYFSSNSTEIEKDSNMSHSSPCDELIPLICGMVYYEGRPLDFRAPINLYLSDIEFSPNSPLPKLEITNHLNLEEYYKKMLHVEELSLGALLMTKYDDFMQFIDFCTIEKCLELLSFWLELEAFRLGKDNRSVMEASWYLYCTYIDEQAPLKVELPQEMVEDLFVGIHNKHQHYICAGELKSQFDWIHHFVEMELVNRSYTRFRLMRPAMQGVEREKTNVWDYYQPNEELTSIFPIPSLASFNFPYLYPDALLGSILSQFVGPLFTVEDYLPLYAPVKQIRRRKIIQKFHIFFHNYNSDSYWRSDKSIRSRRKLNLSRSVDCLCEKARTSPRMHLVPTLLAPDNHPLSRNFSDSTDSLSIDSPPPQVHYPDLNRGYQSQESLHSKGVRRATIAYYDRANNWLNHMDNIDIELGHPLSRLSTTSIQSDQPSLQHSKPKEKNALINKLTQIWKIEYLVKRRNSAPSENIKVNSDQLVDKNHLYLRRGSQDSNIPIFSKENLPAANCLDSPMKPELGMISYCNEGHNDEKTGTPKDLLSHIEKEGIPRELFRAEDSSSPYISEGLSFLETSRLSINSFQRKSMKEGELQPNDYNDVLNQLECTLNKTKPRTPYIAANRGAYCPSRASVVEKVSKLKKVFGEIPPPELVRTFTEDGRVSTSTERSSIGLNSSPCSGKRFSLQSVLSQHVAITTVREDSSSSGSPIHSTTQIPVHWVRGKQWMINSDVSDPQLVAHTVFRRRVGKLKTILGDELQYETSIHNNMTNNDFSKGTKEFSNMIKKGKNRLTQFIPNSSKSFRLSGSIDNL
ncbi:hypothetical protein CONCODRAFT_66997 [Conidiobolus coronatus NRRL 28638]|uniref:RGS domain-containing protein n=1 Tax=Conidiobolus coronatus (strain ATCC 28846 / CBS 209.66 / NRRL 28638) TaxID=796925 RepID=A0A137PJ70_CONC2|nr:hypothetical protein CONCODRAFT_66997 [Conidiobolus coronatus NRRL 28638]|eukprot:KXN74981.1 hypothetical protein CONCODRAFT_66997 [Conidiobolus coronatus NRRL 28638]